MDANYDVGLRWFGFTITGRVDSPVFSMSLRESRSCTMAGTRGWCWSQHSEKRECFGSSLVIVFQYWHDWFELGWLDRFPLCMLQQQSSSRTMAIGTWEHQFEPEEQGNVQLSFTSLMLVFTHCLFVLLMFVRMAKLLWILPKSVATQKLSLWLSHTWLLQTLDPKKAKRTQSLSQTSFHVGMEAKSMRCWMLVSARSGMKWRDA